MEFVLMLSLHSSWYRKVGGGEKRVKLLEDSRASAFLSSLADDGAWARGCVVLHMELWGLQKLLLLLFSNL